jgi:GNAT superfamily N-acetyltransferase
MAPTEGAAELGVPLVEMRAADIPGGLALSEEAGWNQVAADWAMMIRLGSAFAVAGEDGTPIATGLALPYPPDFGWISMVLVNGPHRRRGLGTRILERCIAELQGRDMVPFLDATPAGRPLYERLGFREVEGLTRWQGEARGTGHGGGAFALRRVAGLDHDAFGADRSSVLADLAGRPGALATVDPAGDGFLLTRAGRTATYVGPIVARTAALGADLLEAALAVLAGPVLLDVPDRETELRELLEGRGFAAQRTLTRMALARETSFGDPTLVRAIAGPELG